MQASYAGPLASYNSLTDEHLAEYFSNPRIFKHLRRMGLITRDGRIVDEGIIRVNNARKEHKARSKGVLATSIINRAIEIERKRRGELKKKLELLEKYETVEKVKSQKLHPAGIQEFNPYRTVPPPPPRLSATLDMHFDKLSLSSDQISDMRYLVGKITRGKSIPPHRAKSPYEEELSSRYSTPVPRPPTTPRPNTSRSVRGRRSTIRSRPSTAPASTGVGPRQSPQRQTVTRSQPLHSNVSITLKFIGTGLHLGNYAMESTLSDVTVVQQHCGGNTVTLYNGRLKPKDIFTFVSKRHIGMPYGLTIYLDGMMDSRVSACCEYRHQRGMLLGSKTAHFKLIKVEGGKPCYRCEIELNKKYLKEKQDKEIEMVLGEHSSIEELISPQASANRDEDPPVIEGSPVHSASQTSPGDVDQLEHQEPDILGNGSLQQEDVEEKASLASHSNASVGSMKSISSRVSVASSKSSIHSRESAASKTSTHSSKSSRTSLSSHQSSSSHSLKKVDSSELPAASDKSDHSLIQSSSAMLNKYESIEPETANADAEYNYEDDNFEEPEEIDPDVVHKSQQEPEAEQLDNTDPEQKEKEFVSDSEHGKAANTEYSHGDGESNKLNTKEQSDDADRDLSKVEQSSDTKPDDGTDRDADYNYEDDKFEETNPEETGEPKRQVTDSEDTNTSATTGTPESVEGSKETAPAPVGDSEESNVENKKADLSNDHQTKDVTTDSNDTEVKVPSHQSSSDDTNTQGTVKPASDHKPANKEVPNINEPHASEAGTEDVKDDGVAEDQSQTLVISGDTQEAQIEPKDQADMSKSQQELLPQGILLNKSRHKSTGLSVSFEAASEIAKGGEQKQQGGEKQQSAKDLSASLTIEEAKKMLQKSQSTASLGSLLNERENTPGSDLDLSGSEDEDIPDLEQKISDLTDGDNGETGDKTESQENAVADKENEREQVDSGGTEDKVESQEITIPQLVLASEKETAGAEEKSELQEDAETTLVPESEKEGTELPNEGIKSEDQDINKAPTNSQTEIAKEVTEASNQEATDESQGQDIPPTNSQTETAKEVPDQEVTVKDQDILPTNSQTETVKEAVEIPDQESTEEDQDVSPTNSQTETAKEAETREEDTTSQEAKASANAEGEREGETEMASVPTETVDIGSVKSGLSSSSSKSSLTSVSSQGSQRS